MPKVVSVGKDIKGRIMEVVLDDGRTIDKDDVPSLEIGGVTSFNQNGETWLRGVKDGDSSNNLDNVPSY